MKLLNTTYVRKNEIGLRFERGDLVAVLDPGKHRREWRREDLVLDRLTLRFEHPELEVLVQNGALAAHLEVVDLGDSERALVFRAGRLVDILGAGLHAFWRIGAEYRVERFDVHELRFEHAAIDAVLQHASAPRFLRAIQTDQHEEILVYRDGDLVERFGPGRYVHWLGAGKVTWEPIDLREQALDVSGQEIMTADKVTLRVNLLVAYRVVDALRSVGASSDATQSLYRAAQLALRASVGGRTLDDLLADKSEVTDEVRGAIAKRATELGLAVDSVGLRDVILPGEMKSILNQVIEAQKQSEANLIRRREETAAARSQANTAKLLAENPVLLRMKELEQVGQILAGARATLVLGKGDLTEQLRGLGAGVIDGAG